MLSDRPREACAVAQDAELMISDFRQLEEALATIGRALCSVRARVTKLVDEEGDGTYAPANAWKFDGTVTVSGTPAAPDSYRWLVPGTG